MQLTAYTRRLEECRKRWHRRSVGYVLEVALIVRAARKAAKDEHRWCKWIREEIHMNRTTVYRYLQIARFLRTNDALKHQLASISITKLYALSRLKRDQVTSLVMSGTADELSDVDFLKLVRRIRPQVKARLIRPNLFKSIEASIIRLDRCMKRWQHSAVAMPVALQMKLRTKLHAMQRALNRIRTASAAAM